MLNRASCNTLTTCNFSASETPRIKMFDIFVTSVSAQLMPRLTLHLTLNHQKLSSLSKSRLPSKFVFCKRSLSVKSQLQSKVIFRQRQSSVKCRLLCKVSSIIGCLTFSDPLLFTVYDFMVQTPPARFHAHKLIVGRYIQY